MFENILFAVIGAIAGVWIGIVVHGLELMIKARSYDLVNGQWVKRGE